MKIFLLLLSLIFLVGCASLGPWLRDNRQLIGETLCEVAESPESKIIYIPPPAPSSLDKKKYTGTIQPSLYDQDQYKITIEEQP